MKSYFIVVDDDPSVAPLISKVTGVEVISFPETQKLLGGSKQYNPKALFLDVYLANNQLGTEFVSEIRTRWSYIPIIVMTSKPSDSILKAALQNGADDFIAKPINAEELRSRLSSRLELRNQLSSSNILEFGDLTLDHKRKLLCSSKKETFLTPQLCLAFENLMVNQGMVVSKDSFVNHIWSGKKVTNKAIEKKIYEMRQLLVEVESKVELNTVYGKGYQLIHRVSEAPKILIVDDNEVNCELVAAMLKKFDVKSEVASDGRQAVELVKEKGFEFVLMDCLMPVMDGFEATSKIKKHTGGSTKVFGMLGDKDDLTKQKCVDAGMDHLFEKPISLEDITQVVNICSPNSGVDKRIEAEFDCSIFKTLDHDYLKELTEVSDDNPAEFIYGLFELFTNTSKSAVDSLDHTAAHESTQRLAHKLRGMAENIGARSLAAACERLEDLAEEHNADELKAQIDILTSEYEVVMADINQVKLSKAS